jgi:hypothetical protein
VFSYLYSIFENGNPMCVILFVRTAAVVFGRVIVIVALLLITPMYGVIVCIPLVVFGVSLPLRRARLS